MLFNHLNHTIDYDRILPPGTRGVGIFFFLLLFSYCNRIMTTGMSVNPIDIGYSTETYKKLDIEKDFIPSF